MLLLKRPANHAYREVAVLAEAFQSKRFPEPAMVTVTAWSARIDDGAALYLADFVASNSAGSSGERN